MAAAPAPSRPEHRILLVREWDSQTSGSGCCGRLGGADLAEPGPTRRVADAPPNVRDAGHPDTFAHSRGLMEAMGAIYRALRRELPRNTVDITVVDPRNMVWLIPTIVGDARRRGLGAGAVWRAVRQGVRNGAIVVDGRAMFAHDYAEPDDAVDAVLRELAHPPADHPIDGDRTGRQPPM